MHCVSGYPTPENEANVRSILSLQKSFNNNLIGISDHTKSIFSSLAATTMNIVAIEKHFKISNKINSFDSKFSLTSKDFKTLKNYTKKIFYSLGEKKIKLKASEKKTKIFRRSIFASQNIKKGEKFSKQNIETFRPKIGLSANQYFNIIGKKSKKNIKKFDPIFKSTIVN